MKTWRSVMPDMSCYIPMLMRAILVSVVVLFAVSQCGHPAYAESFRPLTRAEPIVRMVLQEAANEPIDGQVTVAGVAFDRMEDSRWPDTANGVVYQPYQFSGMLLRLRKYSRAQVTRARLAVMIAKTGLRPCGRVLWYHAEYLEPKKVAQFQKFKKHCQIGAHIFYGE